MPAPLDFLTSALAARRLVRLVVEDEVTRPLRLKAVEANPHLGYLVQCQSCTSVYAAGVVALLPRKARYVLAASEVAILLTDAAELLHRHAEGY